MDDALDRAREKARKTYNATADHFDDEPLAFWGRIGARTVARLGLAAGGHVLDVGCGTGASALPAAEAVGPSGHVIGVDLAARLLDRARAKAKDRGLDHVEFRVGDMTALGYPDGCFNAVISVFSIFFVPDMEALVGELWRMVRPGGRLAVTTWGPRIFEPAYSRWLEAVRRERPDLHSAFNPWDRITDAASVRRLLLDGGAGDAEVVTEDGVQVLRSPADWWTVALGSGLRWTIDQMGPVTAARVREDNLRWVEEHDVTAIETNAIYAVARKP
jgi:ubiquinone/menaquinone biosynthesis C-methylase UbiE